MHTIYGYVPHHIATWATCYKWCAIHAYMLPTGYGTYNSLQYHARMVCGYDAHIWFAPFQSSSDMITWNKRWEEKHRDKLRADNIDMVVHTHQDVQHRCSSYMGHRLPSKRPAQMRNKKHPEQVKTDLTNLKVFSTFCRLDCTNSKGFQPSEELEKITAPASLHVTFIDSTQRLTRSSAVFFGYLPNIINDCLLL